MGQFAVVAALALTASAQIQQAGAKEVELELQKREESAGARDREVQRRRRIAAILGTQAAQAAGKGLQLSGSVANISIVDARRAGEDSLIDRTNTRARISALSRSQSSISRVANIRAAGTILNGATQISKRG